MRARSELPGSCPVSSGGWVLFALGLAVAFTSACNQREAPADMRLELPSLIDSRDPVSVTVHATNTQGVTSTVTEGASFAVEPADLATTKQPGLITCSKSGDGKLNVTLAGVTRSAPVRCRLVDKIEAKDMGRVELTSGPFKPKVRVLDKAGAELEDVEVTFVSKNAGVAFPKDGMLVPKTVGTANLTARSGQASADFKVDIVRKITGEALPIDNFKRVYISLDAGKYELKVTLKSPHRVSAEWRGAPYCNSSADGIEHVFTCGLHQSGGGGVVFDNPAYLNDGSAKAVSLAGVELTEIP